VEHYLEHYLEHYVEHYLEIAWNITWNIAWNMAWTRIVTGSPTAGRAAATLTFTPVSLYISKLFVPFMSLNHDFVQIYRLRFVLYPP